VLFGPVMVGVTAENSTSSHATATKLADWACTYFGGYCFNCLIATVILPIVQEKTALPVGICMLYTRDCHQNMADYSTTLHRQMASYYALIILRGIILWD